MELSLVIFFLAATIFIAIVLFSVIEIREMSTPDKPEGSTGIAQTSSYTVDGE